MFSYNLKIIDIRQETSDTKTICLKQPGLKKIKYLPGQYLTLVFRINGRKYSRPYSFSSCFGVDEHLEVTVKRVPGGVVSNHINDVLNIGDSVEVLQPLGDFVFDPEVIPADKHIILWGAGSGITPLISIGKFALNKTTNKVVLIYGNRDFESVIFNEKIQELESTFKQTLTTWHFHSQLKISDSNPTLIEGRIKPQTVLTVMSQEVNLANTLHFICGPAGLKESVKSTLKSLNVNDDQIFSEDFEVIKDPKDFENISTQTVSIEKNGVNTAVEVAKGKSILETGLDAGLDLDYSCQTGSCLLCKAKLLTGQVKTISAHDNTEKLHPGEHLLCCSYPLTSDVSVRV